MDDSTLAQLIAGLRRFGAEPSQIEVKAAVGGLPKTAVETLSAFANTNGGVLVLGIDEERGFAPVGLADPGRLRDNLVGVASDNLDPPLRLSTALVEFEGRPLVVAEIDPIPSDLRPCFVSSKGISGGSFVRVGDGDRRMTQAEIGLAIANRGQPRHDLDPVTDASLDDLDMAAVARTLARVRRNTRALREINDEQAMQRLRILVPGPDGKPVPSLAGLLAFGVYPQQFFPQLIISVVVHPARRDIGGGPRFDDTSFVKGSIPDMVDETLSALRTHMRIRGYVSESGRREQPEYPLEAVREAVVNAVLHRDYSGVSRGTQIQVEMHPDRLVVKSPGGLFGPVTLDELGSEGVTSSRNGFLAILLSDTYMPDGDHLVAENLASGIPAMIRATRTLGQPRPIFRNSPSRFEVEFSRSELFDPATRKWLAGLDQPGLTQLHQLALATMRHGQPVSNAALREYGASAAQATQVLRDLVELGLAIREGGRRYASYGLADSRPDLFEDAPPPVDVADALYELGAARAGQLQEITGLSRPTVLARLRALMAEGLVTVEGAPRSPTRTYHWTERRS
ncbi:ATP-binding protein [Kutzneria sp. NPDC051319]|uniref:ATP-binding protein n=1 Tax=Kutzneria sp. NPDC051319 TaxID=3155047 RepID=UPI00343BDA1A